MRDGYEIGAWDLDGRSSCCLPFKELVLLGVFFAFLLFGFCPVCLFCLFFWFALHFLR